MSEVRSWSVGRTGLPLSLVILRGSFENMLGWVDDESAINVRTGAVWLGELRRGRVREIAVQANDDWPSQSRALHLRVAHLADDWATCSPVERKSQLVGLVEFLNAWRAEVER